MKNLTTGLARIDRERRRVETVDEHLRAVAGLAAEFGVAFDAEPWAFLAGLWHDLGKVQPDFQRRIGSLDTPGDDSKRVEHSGLGAALAHSYRLIPIAFAIAGHHGGLSDRANTGQKRHRAPLEDRISANEPLLRELQSAIPDEFLNPDLPIGPLPAHIGRSQGNDDTDWSRRAEFFTRFIFSALVDADRLTAERFDSEDRSAQRAGHDGLHVLHDALERRFETFRKSAPATPVNAVRAQIADACRNAAQSPPGVFTLDVPTGGGKTLASMRFALDHALANDLRRVIVVIPYTSIITQIAQQYRDIFGERSVLEHHAAVNVQGPRPRDEPRRPSLHELATENWDTPVVVTTTVRFFESLFGASTSACRRLHNIARSVVILDEVQTLPPSLLAPILDGLKELTTNYGVTVVLSTATQPALAERPETDERHAFPGLPHPTPIIPDSIDMAPLKDRVSFRWPDSDEAEAFHGFEKWSNQRVADELALHDRALCIVNTKKDAREIAALLVERFNDRVIHLTTALCPAHRAVVLAEVRRRLKADEPCLLVATQLVEAGVDLDFPIVYRALAGLDSIVQAAGRCNREGKLTAEQRAAGLGTAIVYQPLNDHPDPTYKRATEMTRGLLRKHGGTLNLEDPTIFTEYFEDFYAVNNLDGAGIQSLRANHAFETVEQKFKIIDSNSVSVVVPYGDSAMTLAAVRPDRKPSRDDFRALQPFIVGVYPNELDALLASGSVELLPLSDNLYTLTADAAALYPGLYSALGLNIAALEGGMNRDALQW